MESNSKLEQSTMEKTTVSTSEYVPDQPPPVSKPPLVVVPEDLQDLGLDQPYKRSLIGNFVLWLIHEDTCWSRPEQQAAYPGGCKWDVCQNMIKLVEHGKQCTAGDQCMVTNCTLSKRILSHCEKCTLDRCSVCVLYNYREYERSKAAVAGLRLTSAVRNGTTLADKSSALRRTVNQQTKPASKITEPKDPGPISHGVQSGPASRYRTMSDQDVRNELQSLGALTDELKELKELKELSRMFKQNPAILPEFVEWMGSRQGPAGSDSGKLPKTEDKEDESEANNRQTEKEPVQNGSNEVVRDTPWLLTPFSASKMGYPAWGKSTGLLSFTKTSGLIKPSSGVNENQSRGQDGGKGVFIPITGTGKMPHGGETGTCTCGQQCQLPHEKPPGAYTVFICVVVFLFLVALLPTFIFVVPAWF